MICYPKLKSRIIEKFGNFSNFAKEMHLTQSAMSLKFNGHTKWFIEDIEKAIDLLDINPSEIFDYFHNANDTIPEISCSYVGHNSAGIHNTTCYPELNNRILEKFRSCSEFAEAMMMDPRSMCERLRGETRWCFEDAELAARLLDIKPSEIMYYFHKCA